MTDPQVKSLQQFLNSHGYPVAPDGKPGSKGFETDYFGAATLAAVKKFQADGDAYLKSIESTIASPASDPSGVIGPNTLGVINKLDPTTTDKPEGGSNTGDGSSTGLDSSHISSTNGKDSTLTDSEKNYNAVVAAIYAANPNLSIAQVNSLATNVKNYVPGGSGDSGMPVVPTPGTPEWDAAVRSVESATFDVANLIANATTDQEHAVAASQWQSVQKQAQDQLGLQLSNNALQAWNQVQQYKTDAGNRGISGSGIEAQEMDDYLRTVRAQDQGTRTMAADSKEARDAQYYTSSASPAEIQALIKSNPEKAKQYGLIASDIQKQSLSPEGLKARFPKLSDEDAQVMSRQVLDPSGNFQSTLYRNNASTQGTNIQNQTKAAGDAVLTAGTQAQDKARLPFDTTQPFTKSSTVGAQPKTAPLTGTMGSTGTSGTQDMSGWTAQSNGIYTQPIPGGGAKTWYPVETGIGTPDYKKTYTETNPAATSSSTK